MATESKNQKSNSTQLNAKDKSRMDLIKKYGLTKTDLLNMWKNIFTSRSVDDTEIKMRKQNQAFFQISGAGHEGILTAISKVIDPKKDYCIPYYRDRALCLGLGVTPYEMLCQANGNTGDTSSHGRQMPAHFGNKKLNIIAKSSCTGTQFLQAVGLAEAGKYGNTLKDTGEKIDIDFNQGEIIFVSSGDGTTSQGEFWEGLTTAVVNKLPVLFVIEDNGFAISVPTFVQTPRGSISECLKNFPDLKIFICDGNCPIDSYATAKEAEKYIRSGNGPAMIHAYVTRPYSHSLSDDHSFYRTEKELSEENNQDVVKTFPEFLIKADIFSESEIENVKSEIKEELRETLVKVLDTPWPKKETWGDHLYSMDVDITSSEFETEGKFEGKADIPMATAINQVLRSEVKHNPLIRVFGQDVADFSELDKLNDKNLKGKGGVFKVTSGVQREARPTQVFNSPLAEANIIGRAIGMSMRGLKPVVEVQFFDYIWTAFMQLKNEMATTRYRSGGEWKNPMVVRVPIGGYLRGGSIYHSQSGESIFTHIPGIRVAYPSNAKDAAGLLRTAIRADDPVMFLEHKHLYYQGYNRTSDPGNDFMIPFGKARTVKEGTDATIICWGALVQKSVEAAKKYESQGKSIEVIDLRTLAPYDFEAIKKSLLKTNRIMIAHEETKTGGFAGEIAARINEECFESLDAPILRVTARDSHCAYNPDLEEVILPQVSDVEKVLGELLAY